MKLVLVVRCLYDIFNIVTLVHPIVLLTAVNQTLTFSKVYRAIAGFARERVK